MTQAWRLKSAALLGSLFLLFSGCKSAPQPVEQTRERPRRGGQGLQMPSPEELGDNPCGNPNWAKLPPEVGQSRADHKEAEPEENSPEEDHEITPP